MEAKLDAEGFPVPTCAWHPDRRPVAACVHCGRTVCEACATLEPAGYRCPECPSGGSGESALSPMAPAFVDPVAAAARVLAWMGLVPLFGSPGALAAIGLGVAAQRRRHRKGRDACAPSPVVTVGLGLLGLAGTAVAVWWLWLRR